MYVRAVFAENDPVRIQALIRENPFAPLVTAGARGIEASHVPFHLVEADNAAGFELQAHLSAGNPQCEALDGNEALAVFGGPHAYIAPGWYETQPAVPTWDYCVVHVTGRLRAMTGTAEMMALMRALSAADPVGFDIDAMAPDYRSRMMAGIRAFVLEPRKVEAQWKLSQNRSREDQVAVIAALRAQGDVSAARVADRIEADLPPDSCRVIPAGTKA